MTTNWFCPACQRSADFEFGERESAMEIVDKAVKSHANLSPLCTVEFDKIRIKVGD